MIDAATFPACCWEDIKNRIEDRGPEAVLAFAAGFDDPARRRRLLAFAQSALAQREWAGKNLDGYLVVARAAIEEALAQSRSAAGAEADSLLDLANVLSYNLAADLAPCWPGDDVPRERRHLEAGLAASEDCLRWRAALGKGPRPFSIAHWAKGAHLLALGRAGEAVPEFAAALEAARRAGEPSTYLVDLSEGWLGLAERAAGVPGGRERLDRAVQAFARAASAGGEAGEEAAGGLEQLRTAEARLVRA